MTWLFSKALCESWHFSQEPEAESSEVTCSDGEPFAQLNVTPTPHKFSRNDKTMEPSRLSRFGLTLRLLTDDHGEELLTWFRAAFLVRTYPQQEKAPASTESAAASGEKWRASFAKYDRDLCSWKTHQFSLLGGLDEYSETWPRWGLMLNGECWALPMWELRISGTGSGLWRTPTVGMLNADRSKDREYTARKEAKGQTITLADQVRHERLWPTPTATAHKGWSKNHNRANTDDRIDYTVEREASESGLTGRLNPTWVEWLMGWPIGWTDLKPLEMAKFHEWRQQHSICLAWKKIKGAA